MFFRSVQNNITSFNTTLRSTSLHLIPPLFRQHSIKHHHPSPPPYHHNSTQYHHPFNTIQHYPTTSNTTNNTTLSSPLHRTLFNPKIALKVFCTLSNTPHIRRCHAQCQPYFGQQSALGQGIHPLDGCLVDACLRRQDVDVVGDARVDGALLEVLDDSAEPEAPVVGVVRLQQTPVQLSLQHCTATWRLVLVVVTRYKNSSDVKATSSRVASPQNCQKALHYTHWQTCSIKQHFDVSVKHSATLQSMRKDCSYANINILSSQLLIHAAE